MPDLPKISNHVNKMEDKAPGGFLVGFGAFLLMLIIGWNLTHGHSYHKSGYGAYGFCLVLIVAGIILLCI
jgi:hypothetical protein